MPITLNHSNISVKYNTGSNYIIETVKSDLYVRDSRIGISSNLTAEPVVTPVLLTDNIQTFQHSGSTETQTSHSITFNTNTVCDILIVGGGGGGTVGHGGGGGAGQLVFIHQATLSGTYTIKVGKGGNGSTASGTSSVMGTLTNGTKGSNSEFGNASMNVIAEGGGICVDNTLKDGGSGAGGDGHTPDGGVSGKGLKNTTIDTFSSGVVYSKGNDGGNGGPTGGAGQGGGGGGAGTAGTAGGSGNASAIGHGGDGLSGISEINYDFKTNFGNYGKLESDGKYWFAGGGAGGVYYESGSVVSNGGKGGGGSTPPSANVTKINGGSGLNGTGGGGAGGSAWYGNGGNGGSGIVIIKFKSIATPLTEGNPITHKTWNFAYIAAQPTYELNFPVPTTTDILERTAGRGILNNSNLILQGIYDINMTASTTQIIPRTGQYLPFTSTSNLSQNIAFRYHLLNPIKMPEGAQWTYNSSNANVYHLGNVGIGTTNPNYNLDVSGTIFTSTGGYTQTGLTTWTVMSDRRIKENIVKASYDKCLENVKNIDLYSFNFKDNCVNTNDKNQLGFIAQEVQQVYPKAVEVGRMILNTNETINDVLTLNTTQIDYTLYGAVKYLIEKVEMLEQKLEKNNVITNSSNAITIGSNPITNSSNVITNSSNVITNSSNVITNSSNVITNSSNVITNSSKTL